LRIAFDSWALASRLRYHGTYVYAQNLIAQFKTIAEERPDLSFCLFTSPQASNDAKAITPGSGFELVRTGLLAHDRFWRMGGVGMAAAHARADLIFSPTSNILPTGVVPVVCTIHDAIPVMLPFVHSRKIRLLLRSLMWSAAKFSRAIITVSEFSKQDLISTYQLPESKVSVIYSGHDQAVFNDAIPDPQRQKSLLARLGISKAYVFHHGVIQPRKNLIRLMQAYRLMLSRNRNLELDLVLAGRLGWDYDDILAMAGDGANQRGRVILAGALEEIDLATLIKTATLAVIPSLYEGFCFPMVEAMACGVPTIAANGSCLPEISGGVLKYFDPLSVEDMAVCMEQVLENEETRRELAQRGKQRAAIFCWRRCAEQTLDVLIRQREN
jgi:glycosyltransferase involved in cell wall biosynthesis